MKISNLVIETTENKELRETLQYNMDQKTKPLGSLGQMERIAIQLGLIQQSTTVELIKPTMLTVAADHEIIEEGFASAPKEVTWQQVLNFLNGGGAIGAFCTKVGMKLKVADAGVDYDFEPHPDLYRVKVRRGTRNFLHEPAMREEECMQAIENGRTIVRDIAATGCNVIGFGEMGIGNTSPASALLSVFTKTDIASCVGMGAGISDGALSLKCEVLKKAVAFHGISSCPLTNLCRFGGLEIATIAGGMLQAASLRMTILVDGFITSSAFMVAFEVNPLVKEYAIFAHSSMEPGHAKMLEYLGAEPVLNLDLRLGEGSGAALVYPVVEVCVAMLNHMTSFAETKVFNVTDARQSGEQ